MKDFKFIITLTIFLILNFTTITMAQSPAASLTLKDAVEKAISHHPAIKAEKMAFKAQKEAVKNAHAFLLPTLDLSADAGYERAHNSLTRTRQRTGADADNYRGLWYHTQSLTLTQLLYDGSHTRSKYKSQAHRLDAKKIMVDNSADDIAVKTIESYLDILRTRKIIRLAKENISALRKLKQKTEDRLEKGKGTITDVDRVQLTLSDINALLINYQGILISAQDRFQANTGTSADLITRQLTIDPGNKFTNVESAIDIAIKENKTLLMARANVLQKQADLKTAKGLYHPKVNFIIDATREENVEALEDTDHSIAGLVRVDFNLFKGGGDRAKILQNTRLLSEAKLREDELMLEVETTVRYEYTNIMTFTNQIPLLEQKVEQNLKILKNYEEQFLLGKRDIMDVIDAQKMLLTFQAAHENAETQKQLAQFRLLQVTGQLFKTLGIDFNTES